MARQPEQAREDSEAKRPTLLGTVELGTVDTTAVLLICFCGVLIILEFYAKRQFP
jgi:hypothetical protein